MLHPTCYALSNSPSWLTYTVLYSLHLQKLGRWERLSSKHLLDLSSVVECSKEITSEPGQVDVLANAPSDFTVVPGLKFILPINVSDDYAQNFLLCPPKPCQHYACCCKDTYYA